MLKLSLISISAAFSMHTVVVCADTTSDKLAALLRPMSGVNVGGVSQLDEKLKNIGLDDSARKILIDKNVLPDEQMYEMIETHYQLLIKAELSPEDRAGLIDKNFLTDDKMYEKIATQYDLLMSQKVLSPDMPFEIDQAVMRNSSMLRKIIESRVMNLPPLTRKILLLSVPKKGGDTHEDPLQQSTTDSLSTISSNTAAHDHKDPSTVQPGLNPDATVWAPGTHQALNQNLPPMNHTANDDIDRQEKRLREICNTTPHPSEQIFLSTFTNSMDDHAYQARIKRYADLMTKCDYLTRIDLFKLLATMSDEAYRRTMTRYINIKIIEPNPLTRYSFMSITHLMDDVMYEDTLQKFKKGSLHAILNKTSPVATTSSSIVQLGLNPAATAFSPGTQAQAFNQILHTANDDISRQEKRLKEIDQMELDPSERQALINTVFRLDNDAYETAMKRHADLMSPSGISNPSLLSEGKV